MENIDFEFVNIGRKKEMLKEIEKIKVFEREVFVIDKLKVKELKRIIWEYIDKLYVRYLNIIGIWIGRCVYGDKLEELCIIFYCLDKIFILFGEKKILEYLVGWLCDVREKFIMFGMCIEGCRIIIWDYFEFGCSIGI